MVEKFILLDPSKNCPDDQHAKGFLTPIQTVMRMVNLQQPLSPNRRTEEGEGEKTRNTPTPNRRCASYSMSGEGGEEWLEEKTRIQPIAVHLLADEAVTEGTKLHHPDSVASAMVRTDPAINSSTCLMEIVT